MGASAFPVFDRKYMVGFVEFKDEGPILSLDKRVKVNSEMCKFDNDGVGFTRFVLEEALRAYKDNYGKMPRELSGTPGRRQSAQLHRYGAHDPSGES